MPLYEYRCSGCGTKFELLRSFSMSNEKAPCPDCHQPGERVLSVFASFAKGSDGSLQPVSGTGPSCATCGASSCDTCG